MSIPAAEIRDAPREEAIRGVGALLALTVALVASQWWLARLAPGLSQAGLRTLADVAPLVVLLGLPAIAGVAAVPLLARFDRGLLTPLVVVLVAGLVMRLVWYGVTVAIDEDHVRYLWDGAVLAAGHNPYRLSPKAVLDGGSLPTDLAALAVRARSVLEGVSFPELTTIYPGTAQVAFAMAAYVAPLSIDGLRAVFLVAEFATLAVLLQLLREMGRPSVLVALYWMNPLVVWSSHGTVHTEALLAPLVLGACLAAWWGRGMIAGGLLGLAIGVKVWPLLLAPLLARCLVRRGQSVWPAFGMLALAAGATMLPLMLSIGLGARSGLVAYSEHWWSNNGPYAWLSYGVYVATTGASEAQRGLRFAIALAAGLAALWIAARADDGFRGLLVGATAIGAIAFYASPAQFPWYALWFLPLAATIECRPLLAASGTLAIYYLSIPLAAQGLGEAYGYGFAFLHAVPVWVWLATTRFAGGSEAVSDLKRISPAERGA